MDNKNRKTIRIPLAGIFNQREGGFTSSTNLGSTDQIYSDFYFDVKENQITQNKTIYCEKLPTLSSVSTQGSISSSGQAVIGLYGDSPNRRVVSAYRDNAVAQVELFSTSFSGALDTIASYNIRHFTETVVPGSGSTTNTSVVLIAGDSSGSSNLYYLPMESVGPATRTKTGDTTNTSPIITNMSDTITLWKGQSVSGTGIPAGTRILSVDSATQITLTANATATNATVTLTIGRVAVMGGSPPGSYVGAFQVMNGYTYIMTSDGKIYNSALNDFNTWPATGFISAQANPDLGVGLLKYRNTIVAFGKQSIEFFEDVGNPTGSPLKNIPNATINAGTASSKSIIQMGDTIYFAGYTNNGEFGVFELKQFELTKISDRTIDTYVRDNLPFTVSPSLATDLKVNILTYKGKLFLLLVSNNSDNAFLYDIHLKVWTTTKDPLLNRIVASSLGFPITTTAGSTYALISSLTDSVLYRYIQAFSTTTESMILTSKLDFDCNFLKRINRIRLIGDKAPATATVGISWTDDDYNTYSTVRNVSMTTDDPKLINVGNAFRRRAFKLTNTATASSTPLRLEALEIDYTILDH